MSERWRTLKADEVRIKAHFLRDRPEFLPSWAACVRCGHRKRIQTYLAVRANRHGAAAVKTAGFVPE
ncbi:MAG: hypothetical protein WBG44_05060, partial [Comamonas sp.]